ncbi:hypothetical protein P9112_008260 [Eukaryota sp. TZLM1-RC]
MHSYPNMFTTQEYADHPLHRSWTLHFSPTTHVQKQTRLFENTLVNVISFSSVEKFLAIMDRIPKRMDLNPNASIAIFETDVNPAWEDPNNANGGRIKYTIRTGNNNKTAIHQFIDNFLMFLVGEQFGELGDLITGVFISIKKKAPRVDIWLRSCDDVEAIRQIAEILIDQCGFQRNELIFMPFHPQHCDTMGKDLKF